MKEETKNQLVDFGKKLVGVLTGKQVNLHISKGDEGINLNANVDSTKVSVSKKGDEPVKFDLQHGDKPTEDQED